MRVTVKTSFMSGAIRCVIDTYGDSIVIGSGNDNVIVLDEEVMEHLILKWRTRRENLPKPVRRKHK